MHEYSKKNSESAKESVPGSIYFLKILTFWDIHHKKGQIIHGTSKGFFNRGEWRTSLHCKWNDWIGPKYNGISQPTPDPKNIMHYLDVFSTPLVDGKGRNRGTDSWQPRVQITKAFNEGLISLENKRGNI